MTFSAFMQLIQCNMLLHVQGLRYMSLRHIRWSDAYNQPPAAYKEDALAWPHLWAGCNQLTYLKAER